MEFDQVINKRRSVRKYTEKQIPDFVIRKAMQDALLAPNSSNMQLWEFYWVRSPKKKEKLRYLCLNQPAARHAQELIVAVVDRGKWSRNLKLMKEELKKGGEQVPKSAWDYYNYVMPMAYAHVPFLFAPFKFLLTFLIGLFRPIPRAPRTAAEIYKVLHKTCALACENLMLSIVDQGYACCPMEGFDEKRLKKLLKLSHACEITMVISVGEEHPEGTYGKRVRFNKELFIHEI